VLLTMVAEKKFNRDGHVSSVNEYEFGERMPTSEVKIDSAV